MASLIIFILFCIIGWISSYSKRNRINKILDDRKNPVYWNREGKPIYNESDRMTKLYAFYLGLGMGTCFTLVIGLVYFALLFSENLFKDVFNSLNIY